MNYPSVKTLKAAFGEDKARVLRGIIDRTLTLEGFQVAQQHVIERQLYAIDEVLEGHGVGCIGAGESSDDKVVAEYIDMGNTYDTTILYDRVNDRWRVISWGDWYEWAEGKGIIEPASQQLTVTDQGTKD